MIPRRVRGMFVLDNICLSSKIVSPAERAPDFSFYLVLNWYCIVIGRRVCTTVSNVEISPYKNQ